MNWVSKEFDLGYRIQVKDGEWMVIYQDEQHTFTDESIRLKRKTGKVTAVNAEK